MPGSFSKDARPVRPGAYFDWEAQPTTTIQPNIGSVVALPIVHDWGPSEQIVSCTSLGDFQAKFGPSTDTPGYAAAQQCFRGEGVNGRGGAGGILAYRMSGSTAAKGTVLLKNTAAATAITLTALYEGSYSTENLGVRVRVGTAPSTTDVVITLLGTIIEVHTAATADTNAMVAQINSTSNWVSAAVGATGTALDTSNPNTVLPFVGGDDGATLLPADWTNMLAALSAARFSLFAPFDLTDPSILTSVQVWVQQLNSVGKRFMAVVGGAPADTATTATARSTSMSGLPGNGGGENIVNVGVGTLVDDELGTLSTSQLAPRIAGILAARGESMSLTFARMAGCTAGVLPSDSDVTLCFNAGVVVFGMDSNPDAPIRVEKGLTTYVGGNASKPYLIYRNPKFVRTMHGIELDITDWATATAIGLLQVNDQTRALVVGYGHQVMDQRAGLGVIQNGFTVGVDPVPPPSDDDEFVAVVYGIAFGRSVEQIFNTVYIS
jgi:hypothetical protein